MPMPIVCFRTVDATGNQVEVGRVPYKKNKFELVINCMKLFGHCLGALKEDIDEKKTHTWVFSKCIKDDNQDTCNIHITSVWIE